MPAHFTHIYTARRVSDHLLTGQFPDWPASSPIRRFDPTKCGQVMRDWEKFTAIGAIGPDLFYFSQDYNGQPLGPLTDEIMLALAVYYYFDAAKEDDWEPLLIILDGVSSTAAALLRFLIKLQKIWNDFIAGWNATIGPFVSQAAGLADALTGGLLSEFGTVIDELMTALKTIGEEELLTFKDIFTMFDTCVQKGFQEKLFLWSDMSHYRKPSALCQGLVAQVEALRAEAVRFGEAGLTNEAAAMWQKTDQFLAFTLGYITHLGTDTVGHSFVNTQCGGPFRNHPQRHHLIENHIDAWNYMQTKPGGKNAPDPWGYTDDYPEVSMSALWFAVQITDDPKKDPTGQGEQRPSPLPTDPTEQKAALDVDGHMPDWMAECIVKAMIATFKDDDHPLIYQGSKFQSQIDAGLLSQVIESVTGSGSDAPFPELLQGIAPTPSFDVPVGFPLPWQIKVTYMIMISFYKFSYKGSWELEKPRKPDFIIFPPSSDFSNLFQPPDFSGVDSSNPIADVCALLVALFDWANKVLQAAGQLIEDLIKMVASPGSYLFRLGLYQLAMMIWDLITKIHEVMAHTGFLMPHGEQTYDDGELRLPNEIDWPLITLGDTVDDAFKAALASAADQFGGLDGNESGLGASHPIPDGSYPFYPVLKYDQATSTATFEAYEFKRPWAYPTTSVVGDAKTPVATPTEAYNPQATYGSGDAFKKIPQSYKPLQAGPYQAGTRPDVLFRLNAPVDPVTRLAYEQAQTPWDTDQLNKQHIGDARKLGLSPLGDPIPFSAYLIGQLVNDTGYSTQFNLDSDRAFAYLTWDWIRDQGLPQSGILGLKYVSPNVPPEGEAGWIGPHGTEPLELKYVDPPILPKPPPPPR